MASITLAEASKLSLDDLVTGVIENIVEVNPIYRVLPFQDVQGNAKTYNRENALGNVGFVGIGGSLSGVKAAPSYSKVTTSLTTIIGDAEVNGLLQAQRVGGDLAAQNIASKAKNVGRAFQWSMFEGVNDVVGTAPSMVLPTTPGFTRDDDEFDGLRHIVTEDGSGTTVTSASVLAFADLDELLHSVKSKDGQVDALVMSSRTIRAYRALVRALGGSTPEYVEVAGVNMPAYAGVPIYRSEWIPTDIDNSGGTGTATDTYVVAMNFDDGSEKVGVAGLTSVDNMGVHVQAVGPAEAADNDIWRVKFYSSLAVYSGLAVGILEEVSN